MNLLLVMLGVALQEREKNSLCGTFDFSKTSSTRVGTCHLSVNLSPWNNKAGLCIVRKCMGIWVSGNAWPPAICLGESTDVLWCHLSISVRLWKDIVMGVRDTPVILDLHWPPDGLPDQKPFLPAAQTSIALLRCVSMRHHFGRHPRDWVWAEITHRGQKKGSGQLNTEASGSRGTSDLSWNEQVRQSKKWLSKEEKGQAVADYGSRIICSALDH